ncbi:MAG: aldo/keto reductase [Planctomycetota bacterium]|nr:aldo/keto reductase [Planctomycetota bacterium]
MEHRVLGRTGLSVSALSFGASSLGGVFRDIDEAQGIEAVHLSLDLGINFIDVSPFYGLTKAETVLGKALKGIPRGKYILSTKAGRYGSELKDFDFSAKRIISSIDESLQRLGVEYVDILHAHDVEFGDLHQVINETVPALQKLQKSGKTRFVGVTGLPLGALRTVVEAAQVDTVLSYCHYELNDTALLDLLPVLKKHNVGVISASPLGMGLLSNRGAPSWHPASAALKEACAKAAAHCREHGASIERLALQYSLAQPNIATTLVGSASPENMKRNIAWAAEPLDRKLLDEVLQMLQPVHNVTWPSGRPENN